MRTPTPATLTPAGRIALAILTGVVLAVRSLAGIELPALYSDNMVLQQGARHQITGKAPPKSAITVTYKGISASAKANGTGAWTVELNLRKLNDCSPANLVIELKERSSTNRSSLTLSNVAVGTVWLIGEFDATGLRTNAAHLDFPTRARMRFLPATDFPALQHPQVRLAPPGWHAFTDREAAQLGLTTFAAHLAAELGDGFIGIVQVPRETIASMGPVKNPLPTNPRREAATQIFTRVLAAANREVRTERERRQLLRIQAKHHGIVGSIPSVRDYGLAQVRLESDFEFSTPPPLAFEGAIW
jgi:hypothetical protein